MRCSKILAAIDSRPNSLRTAKIAFEFARQLNATVGLVYVVDRNKEIVNADIGITPEQSSTILLKQVQQVMDQMIKIYVKTDKVVQFMPEGFPKSEIVKIAREWEANLIMMGAHGKTGLFHSLVGSVTEYVMRHSGIPVMIIPSRQH
jgi:nucleotide-binding universal stress UspA family protein